MNVDLAFCVVGASVITFLLGFFGAAVMASRTMHKRELESYWEGYSACNRAHSKTLD